MTLLFGLFLFSLYLLFHISYRKILSQFGEAGSYAYRKQIEMLEGFSDSIREKQERKALSPKEEKRLRSRNDELQSRIEKLSHVEQESKPSFFEKLRSKGSTEVAVKSQSLLSRGDSTAKKIPIISKNIG